LVREKAGVHEFEVEEPQIVDEHDVLVRVKRVGLDGTDFQMLRYDKKDIAVNEQGIVLGHEMVGVVEDVGSGVSTLKKGDYVTMTIRRGCGRCRPCGGNQSDMCMTGLYTERGIHKTHGFLTERVVDREKYILKVPKNIVKYAVLTEPLSIAEKATEMVRFIQRRMPWGCAHPDHAPDTPLWGGCKTSLVIGGGSLGFLATCLLRLSGARTYVAEIVEADNIKVQLLKALGAAHVDVRGREPEDVVEYCCRESHLDMILEASGASEFALRLIPHMARSSVYILMGIPPGEYRREIDANRLLRQIVRYNQVVMGSVNSNRRHFEMALADMPRINSTFDDILDGMFTHKFKFSEWAEAFKVSDPNQMKITVEMD
jgi:threonine dehydrogenase-like Zn-dependent dehydrogenase